MADKTADAVKKSLGRCLMNGDVFSTFYDIFLEGDPRIPELFANTQWEEQKRLLRQGVNNVIAFYDGSVTAQSSMDRIRHTHRRAGMDIPTDLYDVWVDSMVEAVRRHDSQFDAELEAGWREILNHGVEFVRAGYEE